MKLKSYFSGTVEAAMMMARAELGDEALLLNARPALAESRHLGVYEVVFGLAPDEKPTASVSAGPKASSVRAGLIQEQSLSQLQALLDAEVDPELAREIVLGKSLESTFRVDAALGSPDRKGTAAAFVGPPGAGKTTALVQLAARLILAGKPVQILSADTFRIAATEQLRALASILGADFAIVETPGHLGKMIQEHAKKRVVLVDTPGLAKADMPDMQDLAQEIAVHPGLDTHLVLQASTKPADLRRLASDYQTFRPHKLLFTKLDETHRFGALISLAARTGLPISFLTHGQRIPDDLEAATQAHLIDLVHGRRALGKGAAA